MIVRIVVSRYEHLKGRLVCYTTPSTGRGFLSPAGSVGFSLRVAGSTVVGGFGLHGPCLVESLLYLEPWNEPSCAFALIETINNRD